MKMTFEQYLQDKHAAQYQGLDDEMPDNFNEWLEDMGPDEMIEYADKWHDTYLEAIADDIFILLNKYQEYREGKPYHDGTQYLSRLNKTELAKEISNRIKGEVWIRWQ